MRAIYYRWPILIVAALTSCAPITRVFDPNSSHATIYGGQPLTQVDDDRPIDLPRLIDPQIDPAPDEGAQKPLATLLPDLDLPWSDTPPQPRYKSDKRFADAVAYFDQLPDAKRTARRSEIQEALLAKSTTLCNLYKKQVMQTSVEQNLITGDAATLLSGLGAIFAKAAVVRPLAGAGAIANGFRAEYNSDAFADLNIQVITQGIEKRRSEYYTAILKARSCPIAQYPLEEAIKDVFYFHASCSLYAGLEEASLSIKQAQSPGLDQLQSTLTAFNAIRTALGEKTLGTPSTTSPAPAGSSTPDTAQYSQTATSQSVGPSCALPVPGTPKSSVQPASTTTTITTADGKSAILPFANSNNPASALATAKGRIVNEFAGADPPANVPPQTWTDYKTALGTAQTALTKFQDSVQKTQATYDAAVSKLTLDVQSDSATFYADLNALLRAQADNTVLTDEINSIVANFEATAVDTVKKSQATKPS